MPFQAFAARVFGICESIRPSNSRPMSASPQASTLLQVSYSLQASNSFQMSYSPRNGQRAPIKKARWRAGLSIVWENSSLTHTQSQREIDESTRGMGDLSQPNQKQIWTPFQMTHIGPPGTGSPPKPPSDAVAIAVVENTAASKPSVAKSVVVNLRMSASDKRFFLERLCTNNPRRLVRSRNRRTSGWYKLFFGESIYIE